MKNRRMMVIGALVTLCLVLATTAWAQFGQGPGGGQGQGPGWGQNLSPEQRTQVMARLQGLRGVMAQLTPEQREQVKAKVQELRAEGAGPVEVRQAIAAMLSERGIEAPPPGAGQWRGRGGMPQLTPEQRQQVQATVQQLRDGGTSPAEVRQAIAAMLSEWGIEAPPPHAGPRLGLLAQLTPEQRQQVQATVQQMRDGGTSPAEVRQAVAEMLSEWGIELPAPHPDRCPQ